MERNTFKHKQYILSPVTDFKIIAGESFCSGDEDIDDFFINDAERHFRDGMAVTYKLEVNNYSTPIAFLSLQNDAIKLKEEDRMRLGYPYRSTPAVKIGRIGVQIDLHRMGIGSVLIHIIKLFMKSDNRTGCRFITLDAYNKEWVLNFYKKNGFFFLKEPSLGMKTVPMCADIWKSE